MFFVKTYLAPDSYGGTGIFAGEDISKGTIVRQIDGLKEATGRDPAEFYKRYTVEEYVSLPKEELDRIKKFAYPDYDNLEDGGIVDYIALNFDMSCHFNHDDNNNVGTHHEVFAGEAPLDIEYALRDIKKGEELTLNYFLFHPNIQNFKDIPTSVSFLINLPLARRENLA